MPSPFDAELQAAKDAARRAGTVMERFQQDGFAMERKSAYTDLVTEADREAQEVVVETLRDAFPDDGFLGEENNLRPDGEDRVWVIDPIDGTTNFAHGFPYYCTSIALQERGETVVGVVYAPAMDEVFAAVRGEGATRNGEAITVSDIDEVRDALVVARVASRDPLGGRMKDLESAILRDLVSTPAAFRRPGAAALDLCNIAAGRLDGTAVVSLNGWDVAAGALILDEAGGTVRLQEARVFDGDTDQLEVVATNGGIQDELEEVFDRHVGR